MNNFDPSMTMYPASNYQDVQYPSGSAPRSQSQRSRFGFHAPSPYPRPRSSASKPNPNSSFNSINEEPISDNYYSSPDNFSMSSQNSSFKTNYSQKHMQSSPYSQNRSPASGNVNFNQNRSQNTYSSSGFNENRSSRSFPKKSFSQNRSQNSFSQNRSQDSFSQNRSQDSFTQNRSQDSFSQNRSQDSFSLNRSQDSLPLNRSQDPFTPGGYRQNQFHDTSFDSQVDSSFNMSYEANDSYPNTPFQDYSGNQSYDSSVMKPNVPNWKNNSLNQDVDSSYTTCSDGSFSDPNLLYNPPYQTTPNQFFNNRGSGIVKKKFQGNSSRGAGSSPQFNPVVEQAVPMQNQYRGGFRKPMKRKAPAEQLSTLRCEICSIEFTSQIPLDMHLQGAKHARKLKSIEILKLLQAQGHAGPDDTDTTIFRCEPCNASLNGVLQLQTHFEGTRHKQKTNPKPEGEAKENGKEEDATAAPVVTTTPKKKANAANPDAPAKVQMMSCDVCNIFVNSNVQLEQHLLSKKHKAKVEGTPLPTKRWKRKRGNAEDGAAAEEEPTPIPDINTSFVKGETVTN